MESYSNRINPQKETSTISSKLFNSTRIILNVGGKKHDVRWKTLERIPNSRLGKIRRAESVDEVLDLCDEIDFSLNEIYFDRPGKSFSSIIDYYRTGKLHAANDMCIISFFEDLSFWGIDDNFFEPCCNFNYHQNKEDAFEEIIKIDAIERADEESDEIKFSNGCINSRKKIWDVMENPETSLLAKVFTVVSIFFVIISTITLVFSTLEVMRVEKFKKASENTFNTSNFTKISTNFMPEEHIETKKEFIDHPMFETIEIVCIVWFTIEYVLRIWSAPNRFQSMKSPLNIIDLVSILPFYVSLILDNFSNSHLSETDSVRKIFTLFRILRVLRIFKLARHSKGLKAFGQTIQKSSDEFVLLFFFLSIEVLLFSSLVYFAEKDEEGTQYTSIPATFWWAVISITTVGYGDMVPITVAGKLAGALCCISGILVIATPIPIIVNNFSDICVNQNKVEKVLKYKEARNQRMVEIEKRSETVKLIHKELESEEDLAKVCFIQKNKC